MPFAPAPGAPVISRSGACRLAAGCASGFAAGAS